MTFALVCVSMFTENGKCVSKAPDLTGVKRRDEMARQPTRIEEFVTAALNSFVGDPADSDFQRGFLSALIQVAEELMIDDQAPLLEELKTQTKAQ